MGTATVQGEPGAATLSTWSTEIEPQMRPLYDATVAALGDLHGGSVLGAGCGAGLRAGPRGGCRRDAVRVGREPGVWAWPPNACPRQTSGSARSRSCPTPTTPSTW